MLAAKMFPSFRCTDRAQISDFGDFKCGLIPPMVSLIPTCPPCALSPPVKVGKVNPNGGLLPLPRAKMGACEVGVPPLTKVGKTSPGGLPRNSSWTLAEVNQLL